ncbi:glycosyltransferase family 4 protein [Vitreoscilla massiliensis]|uniref:Glycosyltransferase family 4 protein n=2 Tax=Vitreoscilla massiliensis TaxID=1689272 RepID=A0ABY4E5K8_9NEIS|nr:glycosyltransferase family 4 protein [Vitreoscilla massiliensis]UOO90589.1 glycosyltransferase family 4 protein [Vitreoscilla massiliensis]
MQQLPQGKFTIGYTGTLGVANCLDTLINAAQKLKERTEIAFVIVGQGKEKERLQTKVQQLNLGNVTFIDAIPKVQIQSMLATFDVCYIGLTKDDLFHYGVSPNKLFDYFCSGKPIIYAIDSGQYRPVSDADAGIQIEPENTDELVSAIQTLHEMGPKRLQEMGQNGQDVAREQYEYASLAKQLEQVLFSK